MEIQREENTNNIWGIYFEEERNFWIEIISIINNDNIINPLLGKCNHYKFRRTLYLRNNQIISKHNKTRVSILYYIMEMWIHENLMP